MKQQKKQEEGKKFWQKVKSLFTPDTRIDEEEDVQQVAEGQNEGLNEQIAENKQVEEINTVSTEEKIETALNGKEERGAGIIYDLADEQEWTLEESANLTHRYLPMQKYISRTGKTKGLVEKLDNLVIKKKLYLDPQLSLTKLSVLLGVNRTYMSNVLKEKNGFKNYVNGMRLEYFCGLLKAFPQDQILTKKTITKLALKSGFADLRTFKKLVMDEGNAWSSYIKQRIYSPLQVLEEEQKQQLDRMAECENLPPQ